MFIQGRSKVKRGKRRDEEKGLELLLVMWDVDVAGTIDRLSCSCSRSFLHPTSWTQSICVPGPSLPRFASILFSLLHSHTSVIFLHTSLALPLLHLSNIAPLSCRKLSPSTNTNQAGRFVCAKPFTSRYFLFAPRMSTTAIIWPRPPSAGHPNV